MAGKALVSMGATGAATPVNLGQCNGCIHLSVFRPDTSLKRLFCLIFPANGQILHPLIEISNKGTGRSLTYCMRSKIPLKRHQLFCHPVTCGNQVVINQGGLHNYLENEMSFRA